MGTVWCGPSAWWIPTAGRHRRPARLNRSASPGRHVQADAPDRAACRASRRWGSLARPSGSNSPVSSKEMTPLHSRLHPCSGCAATTRAALWSTASAAGHRGSCQHGARVGTCRPVGAAGWRMGVAVDSAAVLGLAVSTLAVVRRLAVTCWLMTGTSLVFPATVGSRFVGAYGASRTVRRQSRIVRWPDGAGPAGVAPRAIRIPRGCRPHRQRGAGSTKRTAF
jgi:hypothetical protein